MTGYTVYGMEKITVHTLKDFEQYMAALSPYEQCNVTVDPQVFLDLLGAKKIPVNKGTVEHMLTMYQGTDIYNDLVKQLCPLVAPVHQTHDPVYHELKIQLLTLQRKHVRLKLIQSLLLLTIAHLEEQQVESNIALQDLKKELTIESTIKKLEQEYKESPELKHTHL